MRRAFLTLFCFLVVVAALVPLPARLPLARLARTRATSDDDNNKYIEIDAVTGNPIDLRRNSNLSREPQKGGGGWGVVKSVTNGIARLFGQDEASKRRASQTKQMNQGIDRMLQGTGLAGALVGGLMKGVLGSVGNMLADAASDVQSVSEAITRALEDDAECLAALGGPLVVSAPSSSSSSSVSVNGVSSKTLSLSLLVRGSRDVASCQVVAVESGSGAGGGGLVLASLVLQVQSTGRVIRVVSGGPRGGPRGGRVVDVGSAIDPGSF